VDEYLRHIEALLSPGLIIVGGGISKKSDKFLPLLTGLNAPVIPARMLNDAGIVGAAMAADQAPVGASGSMASAGPSSGKLPEAGR
jgi:polyphosphate glucokinase